MTGVVETPDWVRAGTEVIVVESCSRIGSTDRVHRTRIEKVAAHSFRVALPQIPRLKRDTQRASTDSGRFHTNVFTCYPADSREARAALLSERRRHARRRAQDMCSAFDREPTEDRRVAALEALEQLGRLG